MQASELSRLLRLGVSRAEAAPPSWRLKSEIKVSTLVSEASARVPLPDSWVQISSYETPVTLDLDLKYFTLIPPLRPVSK